MSQATTGVEKFLLSYIYYEYWGKIYFQSGGSEAEKFIAELIAEEFLPRRIPILTVWLKDSRRLFRGLETRAS